VVQEKICSQKMVSSSDHGFWNWDHRFQTYGNSGLWVTHRHIIACATLPLADLLNQDMWWQLQALSICWPHS